MGRQQEEMPRSEPLLGKSDRAGSQGGLGKRYYVFFILYMKTREIMQYAVTTNPCREFVRQQLIRFSERREEKAYLIHDRSPELYFQL